MKNSQSLSFLPTLVSGVTAAPNTPVKPTVILIRWPVVIVCSYLLLYPSAQLVPPALIQGFLLLYIFSNVAIYFVPEERLRTVYFYSSVLIFDTLILTLSLVVNGHVGKDFYLVFFLLIILSCIFEDPKVVTLVSFLAPLLYTALLFQVFDVGHPSVYLRLPFLFVVSIYYGFFAQLVRAERAEREQVAQKSQAKLELLNLISHELRTPLTLINGFAHALKSGIMGEISAEQSKTLAEILKQSNDLLYSINRMLEVSRLDANEVNVEKEEFILPHFLDELKFNYLGALDKPVKLAWDYSLEPYRVNSDKEKLRIVLENLINNAIKFTDEGEVCVSVRYRPEQRRAEFRVSDTGIGIPRDAFPCLFEKFRQVGSSFSQSYSGMGLGLYMVKALTGLLGGSVTVESEPGKGSTFTVTLPA